MNWFERLNLYHALIVFPWNFVQNTIYEFVRWFWNFCKGQISGAHDRTLNAPDSVKKFENPIVSLHKMASQNGVSLHWTHFAGEVEVPTPLELNVAEAFLKLQGCQDRAAKVELRMGRFTQTADSWPKCTALWRSAKWTKRPHLVEVMVVPRVWGPDLFKYVNILDVWIHFDVANWLFQSCSFNSGQRKYYWCQVAGFSCRTWGSHSWHHQPPQQWSIMHEWKGNHGAAQVWCSCLDSRSPCPGCSIRCRKHRWGGVQGYVTCCISVDEFIK